MSAKLEDCPALHVWTVHLLACLSCDCSCPEALPHGAVDWFAVCDCGIS